MEEHKEILEGYLEAALWSSVDENQEPFDSNFTIHDISQEDLEKSERDIAEFMEKAFDLLDAEDMDDSEIGHLFWLNRNGHGVGFWDRKFIHEGTGDALSTMCDSFGEVYIYTGDDGKIYFQ